MTDPVQLSDEQMKKLKAAYGELTKANDQAALAMQAARGDPERADGRAEGDDRQAPGDDVRQVDVRPSQVDRRADEARRGHGR